MRHPQSLLAQSPCGFRPGTNFDVLAPRRFYTRVLGMKQLPRPPFPFNGAWLEGGGLILHLIDDDPTIPRKGTRSWKVAILPARVKCVYSRLLVWHCSNCCHQ